MLLMISRAEDLHTDCFAAYCRQRETPYLRLCTEQFPTRINLDIAIDGAGFGGALRGDGFEAALDDVRGVWYRRPQQAVPHADLDPYHALFVRREAGEALNGLYRALWDRRWVNPPHHDEVAGYKLHQLALAQQVGFRTPRSIVTNNPAHALAFFQRCDQRMVYKLMFPLFKEDADGQPLGVFTTLIERDDIEQHLDSVRVAPCLFQDIVPKRYELRVNVIGNYVWSTAIYSQAQTRTQLDYRHDIESCVHEPARIPPAVEAACVEITRRLGLRMSNIDMIVTPDGDYVFLEVNPNGQWLWIEQRVGFPLSRALLDELLGQDTLAGHPYLRDRSLRFSPDAEVRALLGEHGFA